jgi:hypothetical protein
LPIDESSNGTSTPLGKGWWLRAHGLKSCEKKKYIYIYIYIYKKIKPQKKRKKKKERKKDKAIAKYSFLLLV